MEEEMQRQDIKTMIDRLDQLELKDEFDKSCITAVISMLEDLGNLVHLFRQLICHYKQN